MEPFRLAAWAGGGSGSYQPNSAPGSRRTAEKRARQGIGGAAMAQPYEKNGRWYFRYRDAKGAWRDKATSARTKTEARRLQLELETRIERQRLGLEPPPSDTPEVTFAEAADLWWSEHGRRLRSHTIRRFMQKHLSAELGPLPLSQVGERLESV